MWIRHLLRMRRVLLWLGVLATWWHGRVRPHLQKMRGRRHMMEMLVAGSTRAMWVVSAAPAAIKSRGSGLVWRTGVSVHGVHGVRVVGHATGTRNIRVLRRWRRRGVIRRTRHRVLLIGVCHDYLLVRAIPAAHASGERTGTCVSGSFCVSQRR